MIASSPVTEVGGLCARDSLSREQRDDMYALLARYFEGVTRALFERDLAAKDWVIDVRRGAELVGFTSLRVVTLTFEGTPIIALYSGDTIVAPEAWGTPALAKAWIAGVNRIRATFLGRRCFWLLLTSGYRTYRFLPVFWRAFHPHFERPTPHVMQSLLEHLAHAEYGNQFDASAGLVRLAHPQRLRGPLAHVPRGREINPHIAYFLRRNPGHRFGDELACITEICDDNLTAAGRRMISPTPS